MPAANLRRVLRAGTFGQNTPTNTAGGIHITRLTTAAHVEAKLPSLQTLLQSCVNPEPSTSSIGFLAPLSDSDAGEYWMSVGSKLEDKPLTTYLFVLTALVTDNGHVNEDDHDEQVLATVQLFVIPKATHSHRAEVAKLLVRPSARRLGVGKNMMSHVEQFARVELGLEVLTLDTKTETPAREFYNHIGWTEWGTCPDYARFADGRLGSATFFIKRLQ